MKNARCTETKVSFSPPPWIDCAQLLPALGQEVVSCVPYFTTGNVG
jgi:hypothetical protein